MDGQPTQIVTPGVALSGVQSGSDFDTETVCCLDDFGCASNGTSRSIKVGQETVPGGLDLSSAESLQLVSHGSIMSIEDRAPALVSNFSGSSSGVDDVSKEHCGQDAFDL
jgi:hypothetical protein